MGYQHLHQAQGFLCNDHANQLGKKRAITPFLELEPACSQMPFAMSQRWAQDSSIRARMLRFTPVEALLMELLPLSCYWFIKNGWNSSWVLHTVMVLASPDTVSSDCANLGLDSIMGTPALDSIDSPKTLQNTSSFPANPLILEKVGIFRGLPLGEDICIQKDKFWFWNLSSILRNPIS